jgi:hypothetical protein
MYVTSTEVALRNNYGTSYRPGHSGTEANTKAIADLTASVSGLIEEMRVGFANVETRLADARGDIKVLDNCLGNLESTAQKLAIVIVTASVSGAIAWFLRSSKF